MLAQLPFNANRVMEGSGRLGPQDYAGPGGSGPRTGNYLVALLLICVSCAGGNGPGVLTRMFSGPGGGGVGRGCGAVVFVI